MKTIETILARYSLQSDRLFGLLLEVGYEDTTVLTCDAWKLRNGGAPQGKFILIKLCPRILEAYPHLSRHLILGRVLNTAHLPLEEEYLLTLLELHKLQAEPDPITNGDLQWCGLKTRVLGTYYDEHSAGSKTKIAYGSDLDLFLAAHLYEAYSPTDEDLDFLINLFVWNRAHASIGQLRYSESLSYQGMPDVQVMLSPHDLTGYRTGIFGVTRLGKSNLLKILADLLIRSGLNIGLLIFDPSGEYTYFNEQDRTNLYYMHHARSARYSLVPRLPTEEHDLGLSIPRQLGVNFYEQVSLGHSIIAGLYDSYHDKRPDYILPFLVWEPVDPQDIEGSFPDYGERTRYRRSLSMYQALLCRAGFEAPAGLTVDLCLHRALRRELAKAPELGMGVARVNYQGVEEVGKLQTPETAGRIYAQLFQLYQWESANAILFPHSRNSGMEYFDLLQKALLRMLGDSLISGPKKFSPFLKFHDPAGSNIVREIVSLIETGHVVIIDISNADEEVSSLLSTLICKAVLKNQVQKFTENRLGDHYVHILFEEAHRLFPADDRNLHNIYNILAKEGAKYHIGMCYATQSISTISSDLLKNTENLFVAHMSDDRELKILSNRYGFADLTASIQRSKSRGYIHMLSLSNRYILPVQIHRFGSSLPTSATVEPGEK